MIKRTVWSVCLAFVLAVPVYARRLPNIDKFGESKPAAGATAALTQKAATLLKENGSLPLRTEPRLGVPTFLWGTQVRNAPSLRPVGDGTPADAESAARAYLGRVAPLYNLGTNDVAQAKVRYIHDLGKGPVIVKMVQTIGGVEIFHEEVDVVMTQKRDLVAISGYITSQATGAANGSLSFNLATGAAATKAVSDLTTVDISGRISAAGSHDGYDYFTVPADSGITLIEPIRMKKVYYHTPGGLIPGYYVEVIAHDDTVDPNGLHINMPLDTTDGYAYVISAVDGSVLFRMNLTADAQGNGGGGASLLAPGGFTYRVWADPVNGVPYDTPAGNGVHPKINPAPDGAQYPFLAPIDVTLPNYPFSYNDPWLAPGATETNGNNVDAYLNLYSPDGIGTPTTTAPTDPPNGDFRAQITSAGQFLHTHQPDVATSTAEARGGSIQQLFYNINFLHDWYYDFGFNETALNAQKNNFGRGGIGNDDIKAQVQDFAGFNNANMLTPADGARPRMRMYAFPSLASHLQVTAPAGIAGKYSTGISMSGPQTFDITTDIVIATFSNSPSACTVTNAAALSGKIAMFDFDNTDGTGCSFSTRITRLTATSASSILMVYTSSSPTVVANITGFVPANTKPIETASWNSGQLIKASLGTGTVTARAYRAPDRDGAIDNQIVFHEWGHYLSNRLIGNGSGLNANYCGGMGEGWGDTSAMLLTVRPDDVNTASNSNWNGAYVLATYASSGVPFNGAPNDGYYYGVRRYPYSTDMNINPLTFKHIADGTALPVGPPVAFGASGASNSEVHNTGEVWAEMLWECYAALLRDTLGANPRLTFQQAQDRWHAYLVASLKITPLTPTMLETRDAVLAAAAATDLVDFHELAVAFAKRGAGIGAISPDRYSANNSPVTESFTSGGELAYVSATLDDSVSSCDSDGVLDNTETGKLTVTLRNTGDVHLGATTATITSSDPNVTIANGGVINFPSSDPTGIIIGTVNVALSGASGVEQMQFNISFDDPDLALVGPRLATAYLRGNTNIIPASTATDTFEGPVVWTTSVNSAAGLFTTGPWTRKQDPAGTNHFWFGPDNYFGSDIYLTSPVFTVDGSGSANMQFDHSWGFEFDGGGNYDGGVVEMSVNGGAWTDVGTTAYNGTILNYSGDVNPLKGRQGFVQSSGGTVHTSLTRAIAPGSTVQFRFRAGSDSSAGSTGWIIDNVAFTGVVETPFSTLVSDSGCYSPTTTSLTPSANPSPLGASLTLTATVSATRGAPTGGTVTFFDGGTPIGSISLTGGVATISTSTLTLGAHTLTATFNGTPGWGSSASVPLAETISRASSSTTLTSSANPQLSGGAVTFTATVTTSNSVTPIGSVTFYDGATAIGSQSLNGSGVGQLATSSLAVGAHSMTASYGGNSSTLSSTSPVLTETIVPAPPTITPGGPTTFCAGGSVTLTSSAPSGNQWSLGGNPIGGATNTTYNATASGSYTVVTTVNSVPSSPSAAVVVTVTPLPATPVVTPGGPTTFCAGGSVTLSSSSASGNQWSLNGNPIGGATNQTYVATASGSYTVVVTTSGCSSAPSAATPVTANPIPATPTITPGGPTTFCTGGSVTLSSSSASGNQWYRNGNPIGGASNQTYVATVAGDYTVIATATGCSSGASAVTTVTINATPNATITAPASVVSASTGNTASVAAVGGATYTWGITNGTITGGTGTNSITFTAGSAGTLSLSVTVTSSGCSDAKLANVTVTAAAPTVSVTNVNPATGSRIGGQNVTITGTGFAAGATVTFGGTAATNVNISSSTTITAKTPAHAAGAVNVTVTNPDTSSATLTNGYTFVQQTFDPNGDNLIDPSDIFFLVNYLYLGGQAPHGSTGAMSGDANGDGQVDPADIFFVVAYLFTGGPQPASTPGRITTESFGASLSGDLSLGEPQLRAGRLFVPVVVTVAEGSDTPQAMALTFHLPAGATIHRAGATSALQPVFEISRRSGDGLSYLVSFDGRTPIVLGNGRSAVVAELELAPTAVGSIALDPALTLLSNASGTRSATVANGKLQLHGMTLHGVAIPRTPKQLSKGTNAE